MAVAPTWTFQFAVNKRQLLENRSPIGSVAAVCVGGIGEIGGIGVIGFGFKRNPSRVGRGGRRLIAREFRRVR
jgi:hypothetical protein